ncbi:MAG: DEAD/DEAH box helicase [Candidatus Kapaibacterium sp.]|nr:MAG: DEAD/DEAH box helicase [Candidatus Kapabacteria bacterium]
MTFDTFGLHDRLLQGISAAEYTTATPIQQAAIPLILEGSDLIGCAQTGTGKTAAFMIPLLQNLATAAPELQQPGKLENPRFRPVRALILSPTRELAQQIEETAVALAKFMRIRSYCIYGGMNIETQIKQLKYSTDILIATPGRLLDLMQRKAVDFSQLEILVLDEADRMLDMGFINDVKKIIAHTPPMRQTLLFSATMSPKIQALTRHIQDSPKLVTVGERRNPAASVTQHFYRIPQSQKMDLLLHVLKAETMESVIVFSRTKHGADRIVRRLERKGFASVAIHSNRSQNQRQRALAGFKQGTYKILVATDVAARGIDIDGISHVINFDTPPDAEDYIHRIGRTGRADAIGDALTFIARDEEPYLRKFERHIGKRLTMKSYPGYVFTAPDETELKEIEQEKKAIEAEDDDRRRFLKDRYRDGGNRTGGRTGARSTRSDSAESSSENESSSQSRSHRDGHQNGYHKATSKRHRQDGVRGTAKGFSVVSSSSSSEGNGHSSSSQNGSNTRFTKKSYGEKSYGEKSYGEKNYGEKNYVGKSYGERGSGGKSYGEKSYGERGSGGKSYGEKNYSRFSKKK